MALAPIESTAAVGAALSPGQRRAVNALWIVAAVALSVHVVHAGLGLGDGGFSSFFDGWVYNGAMVASALLLLCRAIFVADERRAWLVLAAGVLAWSIGDLYDTLVLSQLDSPPYPSLSDALYLTFYPACYVALALLARGRTRPFHTSLWLDGVVGGMALAALGAALLLPAVLLSVGGGTLADAATVAYPIGDVLLLGFVVAVFALTGWRPGRTWSLLGAGLVLSAVGDALFLHLSANDLYSEGTLLDSVWPASILLLACAAWQPARRAEVRLEGARILAFPALFALLAVALLMWAAFRTVNSVAIALATATLLGAIARLAVTLRENLSMLARSREEALADSLTGLGNRRRLMSDLEDELRVALPSDPRVLLLFDLDGFKRYNDAFGHPAGDALLARMGRKLDAAVRPHGNAYRLGGDEFCAIVETGDLGIKATVASALAALSDSGEGFEITSSHGMVVLPQETGDSERALSLADQRMYACKEERPASTRRQTSDVLMRILREREPRLHLHSNGVADLAASVARRLEMLPEQVDEVARAAELHDIGKIAIPDAILEKPGPLDEHEQTFLRRHPILGERALDAAPALRPVAKLVRSSHERYDGNGYPDGLADESIPLGSRIVAVCDAFDAMTSERPYQPAREPSDALAELRRHAGSQFDPRVVDVFQKELEGRMLDSARANAPAGSRRTSSNEASDRLEIATAQRTESPRSRVEATGEDGQGWTSTR